MFDIVFGLNDVAIILNKICEAKLSKVRAETGNLRLLSRHRRLSNLDKCLRFLNGQARVD